MLVDNVVHLDPAPAVFAAMLEGWRRQQSARFLRVPTIGPRIQLVERLARFSGLYPWQWTAEEGEAFINHLRNKQRPIKVSTARCYEVEIGLFIEFLRVPRYGWGRVCEDRFGEVPQPIFHEGNSPVSRPTIRAPAPPPLVARNTRRARASNPDSPQHRHDRRCRRTPTPGHQRPVRHRPRHRSEMGPLRPSQPGRIPRPRTHLS